MNAVGAILVAAAGVMGGLTAARRERERCRRCGELCGLLSMLAFELGRFRTPLPELFYSLSRRLGGAAAALCGRVSACLARGEGDFAGAWGSALASVPEPERAILMPLGEVLGRYGAEEQLAALEDCAGRMAARREELRAAADARCRVYIGVFSACGLMLAVLLL